MYATSGANIKCDLTTFALSLKNAFKSSNVLAMQAKRPHVVAPPPFIMGMLGTRFCKSFF